MSQMTPRGLDRSHSAAVTAAALCSVMVLFFAASVSAQDFMYNPPGQLVSGSGTGRMDQMEYIPGMRYPIEEAPSFMNSQVYGRGGGQGPGGGQCDAANYSYPWWDNYCESRSWSVPMCPSGTGHQGQDIRAATCAKDKHWVVATEAGTVTSISSYVVTLTSASGSKHRYMHMEPSTLAVRTNDRVEQGQRLGFVSNAFGGTPTTIHLHYDVFQTVSGVGASYVPPYMSLVRSYERLLGEPARSCGVVPAAGGVIDDRDDCFQLAGNLQFWREVTGSGYEGRLHWTYAFTSANPGSWAYWTLDMEEGGKYRVEVYIEPEYAQSEQARYVVRHDGMMAEVSLNLSAQSEPGWLSIGEFEFAQGGMQSVTLYDNTGETRAQERRVMVDALRLVSLDQPGPIEEDMGTSPPADMGAPPVEDMGAPPAEDLGAPPPADMGAMPQPPRPDMAGGGMPDMSGMAGGGAGDTETTETTSCASCDVTGKRSGGPPAGLLLALVPVGLLWGLRRRRLGVTGC